MIAVLAGAALALSAPRLSYAVRVVPERAEWRVVALGEMDPATRDPGVFLPDWGGWQQLGARMLLAFACDPPAVPVPGHAGQWRLAVPRGWDGRVRIAYALRPAAVGSRELAAVPLAPRRAPDWQLAFAQECLAGLSEGPYELPAERRLFTLPPPGWWTATGYGPAQAGPARLAMDPRYENGVLAFARRVCTARANALETPVDVVELAPDRSRPPVAPELAGVLARAWSYLARATGDLPLPRVVDVLAPAPSWGTSTPHGTHLGWTEPAVDAESARMAVHELVHAWIGTALAPEDRSLEWFTEGFTEYLALRAVVAVGAAEPAWLARTLIGFRAALDGNPRATGLPFASARPHWRDDDRVEQLIYRKAPLVALALDAALIRAGQKGVAAMVGDLIHAGGALTRPRLLAWLDAHGMHAFSARYLTGSALPDPVRDLAALGLRVTRRAVPLAHLGLAVAGPSGALAGEVTAVEAGGPAARAGVRAGDRIDAVFPLAPAGTLRRDGSRSRFAFGHGALAAGRPVTLHVSRGARSLALHAIPVALAGGEEIEITDDPSTRSEP